jgi:hypothetical protein
MKIEYIKIGDFYFPKIKVEDLLESGKYGRMRYKYIKKYRLSFYFDLMDNNQLVSDLDSQAYKLYDDLLETLKKERGITEKLKQNDQMKWVAEMNNIGNCIDKIILKELICV